VPGRVREGERRTGELEERLPEPALGHEGGHHRPRHPQVALGQLFPGLANRASPTGGTGACGRGRPVLRRRGLDPPGRRRGEVDGHHRHLQVPVSELAKSLDETVAAFRNRPLDAGPYTYIWVDALTQKVREGGRIVNVAVVIAIGVNADGHREILGVDLITTEDGAGWTAFLRGLVARGLSGVALVVSDAHQGLVDAIASVLPGATWQRCRVHFVRNVHTRVPKTAQSMVGALIRSIFEQPDADQVHAQHARVVEQLGERFSDAASMLIEAEADILAFSSFPKEHWRQIWSNNPQERLNKEIRRRTDVVGIFPNRTSVIRLVGAVLAEQHDEWAVARRYMSIESLTKARLRVMTGIGKEEDLAELADVS